MQIMLGDETGKALSMLGIPDRRGEAARLASEGQMGNIWLALANYVAAPAKGGTRVVQARPASSIQPEHLAIGAAAALAAYLALG